MIVRHFKRQLVRKQVSPGVVCWEIIKRLSNFGALDRQQCLTYLERLSLKYSKAPETTMNRLSIHFIEYGSIGMVGGKPVYSEWDLAYGRGSKETGFVFCWLNQRHECFMCGEYLQVNNQHEQKWRELICGGEWCHRLYDYYFVKKYRYVKQAASSHNKEMRFNLYLTDYLRRCANEQEN